MTTAADPRIEALLGIGDEMQLCAALHDFARERPEEVTDLVHAISAAQQAGRISAPLAAAALQALNAAGGGTQLRRPPPSERTVMRPAAEPQATPAMTRMREPAPSNEGTYVRTVELRSGRPPSAQAETPPPAGPIEPGAVIKNRFVIERQIGRGGMGTVFAAIDRRKEEARDPNPRIAIKILNGDFRDHPDALIALQREARKAQTLAHPNVVTVFDFDRDGDNVFMTMELLQGRSLDAVVREARGKGVGRAAALPIIRGLAEGLAYAHRKGIVHSDLKPGNVFLLEDGTPKVLDFGIARAAPSVPTKEHDTFDAGSLGAYTEAYATAEMVEGVDPHPADDVYALGLIAHELLTGSHAYERKSLPHARELGLKPKLPKELTRRECRVLERSLAYERAKRPKDASEFLREFFGATRVQKSLAAAAVVLAIAAGVFGYRDYRASGPAVAFESLPAETQERFTAAMAEGDASWEFFTRDRNVIALYDAIDRYDEAYRLHPRNRTASKALRRTADAFLETVAATPEQRAEAAQALAEQSEYLARYEPVVEARGLGR